MDTTIQARSTASWAIAIFVFVAIVDITAIIFGAWQYNFLHQLANGQAIRETEIIANAEWYTLIGIGQALLYTITLFIFCMWFYGAYEDLSALGAKGLKTSPGRAITSFFIPLVNLIRPYQLAQEVWQASDPQYNGEEWHTAKRSRLLSLWWAIFLGAFLIVWVGEITAIGVSDSNLQDRVLTGSLLASDFLSLLAAMLVISFIRQVEKRQNEKYQMQQKN